MVPLVAETAEEEFKKTVHRNGTLHAKQLVRDIGFDDNIGRTSRNAGENSVGSNVPVDTEASSSDEEDVVEAVIPCRRSNDPVAVSHESQSEVDAQRTHDDGNHTQNQVEVLEEDAPDPDHDDEPLAGGCADKESAVPAVQANLALSNDGVDPELSADDVDPGLSIGAADHELTTDGVGLELSNDSVDPELSTGAVDPKKPVVLQASTSGGSAAEVTAASDTNNPPPVRHSTRVGAGQHSNPHHLPRPAMRESVAVTVTYPQILNCVAQSNLLMMQLLAKNTRKYSRLPITRTFKGNRKKVRVVGRSNKIAERKVKISFYCTVNILITFNCRNVK